ncbi:AraC family transcriptional regulator [Mycobacterium sp. CBMA 234]|uniref:AraC family transcriptional regulator n=1 Tax=Mycolicibacterium sp. CBMA 234 TaxID=1918495 RepID=UPI0012DFB30A|nr:helix-turn-helix transcriptional regulator [Mycolicibacterium sp. CBMA 234]MUL63486.1 AraC family transcriptional regulator [Mycolicibacterium sp. CBMA 234]
MSEIRHGVSETRSLLPKSRIDRHHHVLHQIVYPSTGAVSVTTPAGTWITPPNRAIWIPVGQWHEHRLYGHTQLHAVGLDPARFRDVPPELVVLTVNPLMRELIIACSTAAPTDKRRHLRMLAVLHDEVGSADTHAGLWVPTPHDERLKQACELVAEALATPLSLSELSKRVGASERTLSRLFRDDLSMTYPQWRTQLRLQHALVLLAEHHDVSSVAVRCGWATPSAFIDAYRRALGSTPGRQHGRER